MVTADTTVPWGSVRKEIVTAPLQPVEDVNATNRAGQGGGLVTETWNPVCMVCPSCGRGCDRHPDGPDGTKCGHGEQADCGCEKWGPARLMVRETECVQDEKMKKGTDTRGPGGVGRTAEGWRAFFARGSVTEGGSSSSSGSGNEKNCRVCRAGGELREKRAGRLLCRSCLTPC